MKEIGKRELRRRAESAVRSGLVELDNVSHEDVPRLVQELYIHQAELEIQNDELRGAQVEIEKSRQQYMSLFEFMPVACLVVDGNGIIDESNQRAERLLGFERRVLRGRPFLLVIEPLDHGRLLSHLDTVRRTGITRSAEFRFRGTGNQTFIGFLECASWASSTMTPVPMLLCAISDVTELNRMNEELRDANSRIAAAMAEVEAASAAKTRFLAAASHDLRQPVQALALFSAVLGNQRGKVVEDKLIDHIQECVSSLSELLDGLLDISKLDAGLVKPRRQVFSPAKMMEKVGNEFRAMSVIKGLTFRVFALDREINCDPVLLERILRNIISNAIRYTEQGGVLFGARIRGNRLRFEVWDSGIGIPSDQLSMIFEDFHQVGNPSRTRSEGLGIGLAIVSRLARLLECGVDVRSRPEEGSVFQIDVPLARKKAEIPQTYEPKKKVLLT